jgi:hypothetical protein
MSDLAYSSSPSAPLYNDRALAAMQLYGHGKRDPAIELMRQLVNDDPGNPKWKIVLADFLIENAPRKDAYPTPKGDYEEPLKLIEQVKSGDISTLSPIQVIDADLTYAISLSMSGQRELAIAQFEHIFSNPDASLAGVYKTGLTEYAIDLIYAGRAEDARVLLVDRLNEKWDPIVAATYIDLIVTYNVTAGLAQYQKMLSLHGDSGAYIKRGLCDGLANARKIARAKECFSSIIAQQDADPLTVKYANWRIASLENGDKLKYW